MRPIPENVPVPLPCGGAGSKTDTLLIVRVPSRVVNVEIPLTTRRPPGSLAILWQDANQSMPWTRASKTRLALECDALHLATDPEAEAAASGCWSTLRSANTNSPTATTRAKHDDTTVTAIT
jgi:hypothetical protein